METLKKHHEQMIIKIVLLLSWVVVVFLEGKRDGFFFHNRNFATKPDGENIHWVFTIERAVVLGLIGSVHAFSNSALDTSVFVFSLILIFSWIHNGKYYKTRNKLDKNVYPKGWFDSSTTSESFLEFNVVSRTFMAIAGLVGLVASFTLK